MRHVCNQPLFAALATLAFLAATTALAGERTESFDRDPGWEAHNNRTGRTSPEKVHQDFGHSKTNHAGGEAGEIGGFITPAGEAAYYATEIKPATFDDSLSASGTFACSDRPFNVLVCFFNDQTRNEWRTPNTIAMRLNGRGDKVFGYVEYCTSRWRAGGDSPQSFPLTKNPETDRDEPVGFPAKGAVHRWTLKYDPAGNDGRGSITATIDGETSICNLDDGHKQDGAQFNRFGLLTVTKSLDTGGELWLDDITVNGRKFDFATDEGWRGLRNREDYLTPIVRPRFDFGHSPTQFAGGKGSGELGGLVFRGDCRYPEKMGHYADRLEPLTLDAPIKASGKVALRRGVSDSSVLIGFFDSKLSTESNPSQKAGLPRNFLGISTDGPSRDGFFYSPVFRLADNDNSGASHGAPPKIYPDGESHDWTLVYDPAAGEHGELKVTLDGQSNVLPLTSADRASGARFDRFGIISTWVDGNSQTIYFDDLTYTFRQE